MTAEEFGGTSVRDVDTEGKEGLKEEGRVPGGVKDGQKIFPVLLAIMPCKGHNCPDISDLKKGMREKEKEKMTHGCLSSILFPPSLPLPSFFPPSLPTFKRGLEGLSIHTKTLLVPASANTRSIISFTAPRSVISTHSFLNPHSSKVDRTRIRIPW